MACNVCVFWPLRVHTVLLLVVTGGLHTFPAGDRILHAGVSVAVPVLPVKTCLSWARRLAVRDWRPVMHLLL